MKKAILVFLIFPTIVFADSVRVSQHDGFKYYDYVFSSDGINKIPPNNGGVEKVNETGPNVKRAVAFGDSDIALFTEDGKTYCYNTITNTIRLLGKTSIILSDHNVSAETVTSYQLAEIFKQRGESFGILNYSVLAIYIFDFYGYLFCP